MPLQLVLRRHHKNPRLGRTFMHRRVTLLGSELPTCVCKAPTLPLLSFLQGPLPAKEQAHFSLCASLAPHMGILSSGLFCVRLASHIVNNNELPGVQLREDKHWQCRYHHCNEAYDRVLPTLKGPFPFLCFTVCPWGCGGHRSQARATTLQPEIVTKIIPKTLFYVTGMRFLSK